MPGSTVAAHGHRVLVAPCPLLSAAAALRADVPWARELWIGEFLDAVAQEAEDGITLLASLERHWFAGRRRRAGRRRDSRAAAAVDILAAAPLVSATSLGQALGMATKNATRLLEGFVVLGMVSEVTQRLKRRLYGLNHLAPLRERAAPPRRPIPGRRRGRLSTAALAGEDPESASLLEQGLRPPPLLCRRSSGRNTSLASSTAGSISPTGRPASTTRSGRNELK
jgi:hypothetical protein